METDFEFRMMVVKRATAEIVKILGPAKEFLRLSGPPVVEGPLRDAYLALERAVKEVDGC